MSTTISAIELPTQLQQLLSQREHHVGAIHQIDQTLAGVIAALGATPAPAPEIKSAAPAMIKPAAPAIKPTGRKRGRPVQSGTSASDLILAFLGKTKSATTQEIANYLIGEGRTRGAASNALSVLTKMKQLKRTPLGKGILGSTYSLA